MYLYGLALTDSRQQLILAVGQVLRVLAGWREALARTLLTGVLFSAINRADV
jgi:hypothetical protein